jgi:glycosyltransferase involved in cell wall biosynthesis
MVAPKIIVLSDEHFPHTGADTEVIMKTSAAMGAAGADVQLIVPRLWKNHLSTDEVLAHYGVSATFELVRVPTWPPPERKLRLERLLHGFVGPLLGRLRRADVVHSRDALALAVAHVAHIPWSLETYRRYAEEQPWLPRLFRRLDFSRNIGAVAHSEACAADLKQLGFPSSAVLVARCGCDPDVYDGIDRAAARSRLGIASDARVLGYAGNVAAAKGIDELFDVAAALPEVTVLVVGGNAGQVETLRETVSRKNLTNVILTGRQPPSGVPQQLAAADILFSPTLTRNSFAGSLAEHLPLKILPGTPLKLYGYMAAGRPIVAADQPINREVLRHEEQSLLFPAADVAGAAAAVRRLVAEPALAQRLGARAREQAREHTWAQRGREIVGFFERRLAERREPKGKATAA